MPPFKSGTKIDSKGYPAITAGPHRGKRVHQLVAEAKLGRALRDDEEVHHRDGNKLNCRWDNLDVLGKAEHGAVSARQAWYFRTNDIKAKKEWDRYFDEEGAKDGDSMGSVAVEENDVAGLDYSAECALGGAAEDVTFP